MYFSAAILPLAYVIGMLFTFKTHTHIFQAEEHDGDDGAFILSAVTCDYVVV
jgi:Ca2+/H+ antiporter